MDLLDVQPYETGLHRLLRAGVCSDDQLHDYYLSQALRGVTYAVNRTSLPFPNLLLTPSPVVDASTINTTAKTTNTNSTSSSSLVSSTSRAVPGGVAVLCRMCISSLASHTSLRTVVYLSTRLLCDEATAFGEGNERPSCTQAWMEALCAVRHKMFLREQMRIHRRLTLGYILTLAGTVSAVGQGHVVGKRLTSHFPEFTQYVLDDILPYIAIIADTNEGMEILTTSITEEMRDNDHSLTRQHMFKSPSRLTAEANNSIIDIFHNIARDVLDVHQGGSNQRENRFVVLDRDVPMRMWPSISILCSALRRALKWIQQESIWHIPSIVSSSYNDTTTNITNREIQGVNESFEIVKTSLDAIFAQLLKQQETLECSLKTVEQQFGQNAKDYNEIRNMMWVNTLRLCFLCRTVTSAWTHIHGNNDNIEVHKSDKKVLAFIASFMSSVPVLEEKEKELDVFFASSALLSAAFACLVASPISMMQGIIWSSDINITQEIHKIIIHRALRYKDENVQKLGALLSRLILYSSSSSSAVRTIAESSDQLLELLTDGRDAASQCVTGMLMRAAVERPHVILPALFRRLQHGDTGTRRNVLDVLSALPQLCEDSAYGKAFTSEQMRPVLRLMSEELLLRIQDEELLVRLQSSKLFAKVWPEDICRPLLHLATQRDKTAKKQSAAQEALISIVEAHKNDASMILLLVQESLSLLGKTIPSISATPSTPADILAFSKLHACGVNNDNETYIDPNTPKLETTDSSSDRLLRLIILLVRRWAEIVPKWTEMYTTTIIERLMEAHLPIEQEFFVRVIGQIASICGKREDGAFALLSSCLHIMKPEKNMKNEEEEEGNKAKRVLQLGLWLDTLFLNNNDTQTTMTSQDTNKIIYQAVAPLICLRSCPRSVFLSPTLEDLSSFLTILWDILWTILLSTEYRERLPLDVQRLLLELVCKYSASKIFQKLKYFEEKYAKDTNLKVENISCNAHFIRRVGFFCIGTLLSQNKDALAKEEVNNNEVTVSDKEECGNELLDLLNGAIMALRWTEDVVLPWLLSDESGETNNVSLNADTQRLSRAAVECMGFITIVSLRRKVFYDTIVEPIMIPFYQLATLYREQIKEPKDGQEEVSNSPSSNNSANLLGRFEFAIHVQQSALGIIRTHPLSKELLAQWFTVYMPPLIELANASCTVASRLSQNDVGQVAMECCHVLFLAVMSSRGLSQLDPTADSAGETGVGAAIMAMDPTDRGALVAFAVGTARYANLPRLQAAGVKLLAALLAAAPTAFTAAAAAGAVAVLQSVAHIHEDSTTRALAEHVLSLMEQGEGS
ncbi:hypothetical protein LSM04_002488 [Trypanosoma melophagium]|uniref:uncharacterized protein n=1 Tax=Trypanosoma melophagium TaxID=715481 RepID=UPI00351AA6D3|nr:hypothetical protein LSM04_002488 [Trypanosoma melophagium]